MDFNNKVAIVTGANSGIGEQVSNDLLARGCKVMGCGLGNTSISHNDFMFKEVDITNESQCIDLISTAVKQFDQLDILINCAGITIEGDILETTEEIYTKQFDINVKGTFNLCKSAVTELTKTHGCIVNISSDLGIKTAPKRAIYSASKAAVISLTESIAVDFAPHVRANTVCPGLVDTPMIADRFKQDEGLREVYNSFYLLNKIATPQDISNSILFLSSNLASHITGETLVVNGGGLLK